MRGIEAPLGVYASLGNHDKHDGTAKQLIDAIEQAGITVLYDEAEVVANEHRSMPLILLDHQPYELDVAQRAGIDLMLPDIRIAAKSPRAT